MDILCCSFVQTELESKGSVAAKVVANVLIAFYNAHISKSEQGYSRLM